MFFNFKAIAENGKSASQCAPEQPGLFLTLSCTHIVESTVWAAELDKDILKIYNYYYGKE